MKQWLLPPGWVQAINRMRTRPAETLAIPDEHRKLLERNLVLRNRHRGERCFILGAGPSVKRQNLKKLAGEVVISVSNTFVHPDYDVFKPRYHVLPHLLRGHGVLHDESRFVAWLTEMEARTGKAEMFLHLGDKPLIEKNGLFRGRAIHWNEYCAWDGQCQDEIDLARIPAIWSVSEFAISVALFLGFDEIYLLGFDHDWFNGLYNYFYDEKTDHMMKPDISKMGYVDAEFQMRRHADIFKKYKCLYAIRKNIFNANADPKHYLDVFPKVDFDSILDK